MNTKLKKYSELTTLNCKEDSEYNLLEGLLYIQNALKFINLLSLLESNDIQYKLIAGFKGPHCYNEHANEFKNIVISIQDDEQRSRCIDFIDKRYNNIFKTVVKEKQIKIHLLV